MLKFKTAFAVACMIVSGAACADTFIYNPHLIDGYKCTHAQYCNMGGNVDVGFVNETDEAHDYHITTALTSDAGAVEGPHAHWTADIHVPAHDSWGCNVQLIGYVKINNPGQRAIGIVAHTTGAQQFDRETTGWIQVV